MDAISFDGVDLTQYFVAAKITELPEDSRNDVDVSDFSRAYDIEGTIGVSIPSLARLECPDGTAYLFDEEESDQLMAAGASALRLAAQFLTDRPRDPV